MKEIVAILILCLPLVWETLNDKDGDINKKRDVVVRALFIIISALIAIGFTDHNFFLVANLSFAIHWLFFDYMINIILFHNGVIASPDWFSYLGRSSKVDNIKLWRIIGPYGRLFVKLTYFLGSIFLYFKF